MESGGAGVDKGSRSAGTIRRLKMYNTRPKRDTKGKVLKHDLQSKELPSTRIVPDRRWFGNTRVVEQKELAIFREELTKRRANNYEVLLKEKKLLMSLLVDPQKEARAHLLDTEPFKVAFGPKRKIKRPRLLAFDYESLVKKADGSHDAFEKKHGDRLPGIDDEEEGFRDMARHSMFEKRHSKRIWGELYKVVDSSDVVVQILEMNPEDEAEEDGANVDLDSQRKGKCVVLKTSTRQEARAHLLDTEPFKVAFGPKRKRKRPRLLAFDYESLVKKADGSHGAFEKKHGDRPPGIDDEEEGFRDMARHSMFEKGQSKRIWGELYKVVDSSDVVVQVYDTMVECAEAKNLYVQGQSRRMVFIHKILHRTLYSTCTKVLCRRKAWH